MTTIDQTIEENLRQDRAFQLEIIVVSLVPGHPTTDDFRTVIKEATGVADSKRAVKVPVYLTNLAFHFIHLPKEYSPNFNQKLRLLLMVMIFTLRQIQEI